MNRPSGRRPAAGRRSRPAATTGGSGAAAWDRAGRGRAARERGGPDGGSPDVDPASPAEPPPARRSPRGAAARARTASQRPARTDDDPPPAPASRRRGSAPAEQAPAARRRGRLPRPGRMSRSGRAAGTPRRPVPPRYRRRRLVAALVVGLLLLAGVALGTRVLLYDAGVADVEDVAITGLSTVPEPVVRDAVAVEPGGPLISVDTVGIARRVAAVEGVAAVEVRRAWPHTVEVDVTERVPVALWQTGQGLFEVDATGLSYRRAPRTPPALPRLTFEGVGPQDPSTGAALAVLRDLAEPLRVQVATVDVAGTQVTLGLGDGRSVRWGDPERSADKNAVLGPLLGRPGSVYDVSSPDLPTVRQ